MSTIEYRVRSIINAIVGDHYLRPVKGGISLDDFLIDDLGFDFADEMRFVWSAEEEFGVELPDVPFRNDTTVRDLIALIEGAVRESPA